MSNVQKISIALPSKMASGLKKAVEKGGYSSASEIVREALRDWELKQAERRAVIQKYRKLVQDGIDSGPAVPFNMDDIIDNARGKLVDTKNTA